MRSFSLAMASSSGIDYLKSVVLYPKGRSTLAQRRMYELIAFCVPFVMGVLVANRGPEVSPQKKGEGVGLDSLEPSSLIVSRPYRVVFTHPLDPALLKEFSSRSILLQSGDRLITGKAEAERRAREDMDRLRTVCENAGYFDVAIRFNATSTEKEILIEFSVELGQRYWIRKKTVTGLSPRFQKLEESLTVSAEEPVDLSLVQKDQQNLRTALQNQGAYFAHFEGAVVTLDREAKRADVLYPVSKSFLAIIDSVRVEGAGDIPQAWILKRATLRPGKPLTLSDVTETQESLLESGLLASLEIQANAKEPKEGTAPTEGSDDDPRLAEVVLNVKPLPPRTLGVGAYISVSEGPFATLLWRHKNFLKKAWSTGTIVRGGLNEVSAQVFLDIPDLLTRLQRFHSDVTLLHMSTPAYEGNRFSASCGFAQDLYLRKKKLSWSLLPVVEGSKVTRDLAMSSWWVGVPFAVEFNLTNHRFTPTSGVGVELDCRPYWGSVQVGEPKSVDDAPSQSAFMAIVRGKIRAYFSGKAQDPSGNVHGVAAFVSAGSVLMKDTSLLPYDKRFYGGGRSSLRSYGYQLGSHLDEKDRPTGGVSIVEACIEPRLRLSEDFGMVLFVETCCTSDRKWVHFDKDDTKLVGWGFGVRYFTRFGPIRFDLGFPTQRRASQKNSGKKVDKAVQFYLSVGQCF